MIRDPFTHSLRAFASTDPLRLHMPGHKGKSLPLPEWDALAPLDFTELPPTGNLYGPGDDFLEEAQRLWAMEWGMGAAFFLTGGATQGIFAMLNLFCRPGDTVLLDRMSHQSIHNALALFDLSPRWLTRPLLPDGTAGPLSPARAARALDEAPGVRALVVTSPTYYGVCSDLPALAEVCRARGVKLLVDGAHGAHLPLVLPGAENCPLGENPYLTCDAVTVSTHKTLPAPGQTGILFVNGRRMEDIRAAAALTSTTSPSYAMMAALDSLRPWLRREGRELYRRTAQRTARLRARFPALTEDDFPAPARLDPCRLTLCCRDGFALERALQAEGIYPEMADPRHVVAILTAADDEGDFVRLAGALSRMEERGLLAPPETPFVPAGTEYPLPVQVLSPRAARFGPGRLVPLCDAAGQVAAQTVAPYPPGVPVLAPGERVTEKCLAYLEKLCYDKLDRPILVAEEDTP